jgi:hypothetical protein
MSARSVLSEFSNERSTARKDYEKGLGIDLKAGRRRELPPTMPVNPDMSLEYRVACASDLLTSERGFHSLVSGALALQAIDLCGSSRCCGSPFDYDTVENAGV